MATATNTNKSGSPQSSSGPSDLSGTREELAAVKRLLSRRGVKVFTRAMIDAFSRNEILNSASAISFQVLVALVPLVLLIFVLAGYLGLESIWTDRGEPFVSENFAYVNAFAISTTVQEVINQHKLLWLLMAAGLTVWEWSGSVRAAMGALNRIYEVDQERSTWRRFGVSFLLAVAAASALLAAVASATLSERLFDFLPGLLRGAGGWALAIAFMWLAVFLLLKFAPAGERRARWLTFGSALIVLAWVGASLVFAWYVTQVADFQHAFGAMTSFIVLAGYVYTSSIIFLVGPQVDELLRSECEERALTKRYT